MPRKLTRFESLLQAVPDALLGMDQEGVIRFVNRQAESLFGYDRDEMVGQLIETLVPESLWQIYTEHREDYFADPRTRSGPDRGQGRTLAGVRGKPGSPGFLPGCLGQGSRVGRQGFWARSAVAEGG